MTENNIKSDTYDKKNPFESKEAQKLASLAIIDKVRYAIKNLTKEKAVEEIQKLRDTDKARYFTGAFDLANDFLNGKIPENGRDGFNSKLQKIEDDTLDMIDNLSNSIIEEGIKKQTKQEIVDEIMNENPDANRDEVEATVNEAIEDENEAFIDEKQTLSDEPFKLSRPKIDKIKKIYTYKVEGKIKSGIPDLDNFLAIIQPAINQVIIQPWKLIYGTVDAKNYAFEKFENWQSKINNLKTAWGTLEKLGAIPKDKKFKYFGDINKKEDEIAGYFNAYATDIMNDKFVDSEELAEKGPRKKLFDYTREPLPARKTIDDILLNLIKNNCRGEDGKISEGGAKLLKGFSIMVDLFNKEDKDKIPSDFTCDVGYIMQEAKGRTSYTDQKIEDVDVVGMIDARDKKAKDDDYLKNLAEALGQLNGGK